MTLRELFKKLSVDNNTRVVVTVLGYFKGTNRYYSFYTYYDKNGLDKKAFEEAPNNILDCEIMSIDVHPGSSNLWIDVKQYTELTEEDIELYL